MRTVRTRAPAVRSSRLARFGRGSPPSEARSGGGRAPKKGSSARGGRGTRGTRGTRLRGLRWVPVPLAILAAALGVLVFGSVQGQAAADLASHPTEAGGLSLSVDTMLWLSDDMTGNGDPNAAPPPDDDEYDMPSSMMPGMEPAGDNRLRVEVDLTNVTVSAEQYATTDFTLSAPGGKTWQVDDQDHSALPASAYLRPGFSTTIDVYFDVPAADSKNLTLRWSRGGRTISIPVNTTGKPSSTGANMSM
jgi:hypothetical protein